MKNQRQPTRLALLVVFSFVTLISLTSLSAAADHKANVKPQIHLSQLKGAWAMTQYGQGGCGTGSALTTFTLNAKGSSTNAVENYHDGCGDGKLTGQTFTITSLNSDGSGTAGLTCGSGCGFTFSIQVAPDANSFSLVDITDPGNYQIAAAIRQ